MTTSFFWVGRFSISASIGFIRQRASAKHYGRTSLVLIYYTWISWLTRQCISFSGWTGWFRAWEWDWKIGLRPLIPHQLLKAVASVQELVPRLQRWSNASQTEACKRVWMRNFSRRRCFKLQSFVSYNKSQFWICFSPFCCLQLCKFHIYRKDISQAASSARK